MDEITIPDDLSTLNATELKALLADIDKAGKAYAAAAREAEGEERTKLLATLETLKAAKTNVMEAVDAAEQAEADAQKAIDDAEAAFGDDETDTETETEADGGEGDGEGDEQEAETETEATVAASGTFSVPKPKTNREVPVASDKKPKARKLFSSNGGKTDGLMDLAAMFSRASKAAENNGDGMARVATFARAASVDQDAFVSPRNSAMQNTQIMLAATPDDDFIAAAGGFCGPGEIVTEIPDCGRTDRPIGSRLGVFRARGAYQYTRPVGIDEVATGLDYWTEAKDIAAATDPDVRKPCYPFECQEFITAVPVAIPMCFQYGTFAEWSFPEQVASQLRRFDVALARHSEALVLQRIHEQSLRYSYTGPVGESAQNNLTRLVGQLLALAGYNGRNSLDGYTLVLPDALLMQVIIDAKIKAWVGPTLTRAQIIAGIEDAFNIAVITTPDVRALAPAPVEPFGTTEGGAGAPQVPCFHTSHEILLLDLSSFRHSVDDVDIAVQTSITEAKANNKHVFLETIDTTEKLGCEPAFSVKWDNVAATGSQPDLVPADPDFCEAPIPAVYGAFPGADLV